MSTISFNNRYLVNAPLTVVAVNIKGQTPTSVAKMNLPVGTIIGFSNAVDDTELAGKAQTFGGVNTLVGGDFSQPMTIVIVSTKTGTYKAALFTSDVSDVVVPNSSQLSQ